MPRYITEAPKDERSPIPSGAYVFTLTEIKDYESEDRWNPNPDGTLPMKKQLIWILVSDKVDPETKKPYEIAQFTGLYYGDDRANMTKLLDWMLPDVDHDTKRKGVDIESLIGRRFKGRVQHTENERGEMKPKLTMLDPLDETDTPDPSRPVGQVHPPVRQGTPIPEAAINVLVDEGKRADQDRKQKLMAFIAERGYENWGDFIRRGSSDAGAALLVIRGQLTVDKSDELPF